MKNLKTYSLLLLASGLLLFNACTDDTDPEPDTDPDPVVVKLTYTADAAPILDASCAVSGCHISGATIGSMEGYADAKVFADFGRLGGTINHTDGFSPMPKNGDKLSDENIATLENWIADGLLE
jgi:hypothetical protein